MSLRLACARRISFGAPGTWFPGLLKPTRYPRRLSSSDSSPSASSTNTALLADNASQIIGSTPLVRLTRLCAALGLDGEILAKCEQLNPGYSKKDRIALQIVEDAEKAGALAPGGAVVELTSGNTGTGLAIVCAVKGYKFVAVMSEGNSMERARMMSALGAEVVLVPQQPGSVPGQVSGADLELVDQRAQQIVAERGAFRADQFNHQGNFRAHFLQTGPEIISQAGAAGLRIDAFCDFVGSGGTFAGIAAALQASHKEVSGAAPQAPRCYIVEPANAAVLAGGAGVAPGGGGSGSHKVQGGGYSLGLDRLPMIAAHAGE